MKGESNLKTLLVDTRQQAGKHNAKDKYFESVGIPIVRSKLPCGDYSLMQDMSTVIDSKKDIQELIGDICGKQHERFRRELQLAQDNGIKLIVLVENEYEVVSAKNGIENLVVHNLNDLFHWVNKRSFLWKNGKQLYPNATKGTVLAKACLTMQEKYGVEFKFCSKSDSGRIILELLGVEL